MVTQDLIDQIAESAFEVYAHLLDGHSEKIYERALAREFRIRGVP